MKLYSDYKYASISMSKDLDFKNHVEDVLKTGDVKSILECGTFNGLGSTTMLAEIIVNNKIQINHFYTLEVEKAIFEEAKLNLKKYPFVNPIWGMSLSKEECLDFIEQDEAINFHEKFPNIFIDSIDNPKKFYKKEIEGNLTKNQQKKSNFFLGLFKKKLQQSCLKKYIPMIKNDCPLILLDSAGGVGFLEFKTAVELMGNTSYYLILDDVHHLKHFRSLEYVSNNNNFKTIAQKTEQGWALVKHL